MPYRVEKDVMNAEQRLREHIGQKLSLAGFDDRQATDELKNQILELFREYSSAPDEAKADVYLRGEKRIIKAINIP